MPSSMFARIRVSLLAILVLTFVSTGTKLRAEYALDEDAVSAWRLEGYVFVDGQYLSAPYDIRTYDGKIVINEKEFSASYFGIDASEIEQRSAPDYASPRRRGGGPMGRMRRDNRFHDGDFPPRPDQDRRSSNPLARLADSLSNVKYGAVAILYENEKPVILQASNGGKEILGDLTGLEFSLSGQPSTLSPHEKEAWDRLAAKFSANDEFFERASADIERTENAIRDGERAMFANSVVSRITYPLTLLAMFSVVLGFGHLLSYRPSNVLVEGETSDDARRLIAKTIGVIALLSVIDLVWTLAATNAGTMRELNPLGSQIVDNPWLLSFFKVAVTGGALAIMYKYYQRSIAQVAAWWCCLVLVLLTARWIIFQSMFV